MKIVWYTYLVGKHVHRLYVDADYDSSRYPTRIREFITKGGKAKDYDGTILDFGDMGGEDFKKKGYLEDPTIIIRESVS